MFAKTPGKRAQSSSPISESMIKAAIIGSSSAQQYLVAYYQSISKKDEATAWQTLLRQKTDSKVLDGMLAFRLAESFQRSSHYQKSHLALARAWYYHAAHLGQVNAQCLVAIQCAEGLFGESKRTEAQDWFHKAERQLKQITEVTALVAFAKGLYKGWYRKNQSEDAAKNRALNLFYLAAAAGSKEARHEITQLIIDQIRKKRTTSSLTLTDDPFTQATAAILLRPFIIAEAKNESKTVDRHVRDVNEYLDKIEQQCFHIIKDKSVLNHSYQSGMTLMGEAKFELALSRFEMAAISQGDANAAFQVGNCCQFLPTRMKEAFQWWQLAATAGDSSAQYQLSRLYQIEYPGIATILLKKSTDSGNKHALYECAMDQLKNRPDQALIYFDKICGGFSTHFSGETCDINNRKLMIKAAIQCIKLHLIDKRVPQDLSMARAYYQLANKLLNLKQAPIASPTSSSSSSSNFLVEEKSNLLTLHTELQTLEIKWLEQKKEEAKQESNATKHLKLEINPLTPMGPAVNWNEYYKSLLALLNACRYGVQALTSGVVGRNPITTADYASAGLKGIAELINAPIISGLLKGTAKIADLKIDAIEREHAKKINQFLEEMETQDKIYHYELDFLTRLAVKLTFLQKDDIHDAPKKLAEEDSEAIIKFIIANALPSIDQLCQVITKKEVPSTLVLAKLDREEKKTEPLHLSISLFSSETKSPRTETACLPIISTETLPSPKETLSTSLSIPDRSPVSPVAVSTPPATPSSTSSNPDPESVNIAPSPIATADVTSKVDESLEWVWVEEIKQGIRII